MNELKKEIARRLQSRRNGKKHGWSNLIIKILLFSFLIYAIRNFMAVNDFDLHSFFSSSQRMEKVE